VTLEADQAGPVSAGPAARVLAPLRDRDFRLYFIGQLLSQIGDGIFVVSLPFLVLRQGGGTVQLGIVLACYGATRLAALPVGGTIADRLGARTVMLWSDAARVIAVLALAYLATQGHVATWALIAFAVPFGALDGLFQPASYAVLPEIVADEALPAANSLNSTMQSVAQIAGPAIGGLVVAGLASGTAFLLDAVTFAVSSATLLAIRRRRAGPAAETSADPEDGPRNWTSVLRYLWSSRLLRMSLLVTVVVNLAYDGMMEVALPDFALNALGGAWTFGVIMAGFGLGSVVGALFGETFLRLRHRGRLALCVGIAQGLAVVCIPIGATVAGAVAAMFVAAALQAVANVFYLTMLQRDVPSGALGRVMSLMLTCAYLAYPVSTVLSGAVSAAAGPAAVIVAGGVAICAAFAIGFTSKYYRNL